MISIACGSCSAKYRLPDTAAGKRGKCKKCGHEFRVPTDEPLEIAPLPPESSDDDLLAGLGAGAALATPNIPLPAPRVAAAAPSHGGIASVAGGAKAVAGALGGAAKAGSPLVMGCIFSAVGAAIGA